MPQSIDMPAPPPQPGNTYARGMCAVLRYMGADVTYEQVMGLTGVAFILHVSRGRIHVGRDDRLAQGTLAVVGGDVSRAVDGDDRRMGSGRGIQTRGKCDQ